jgi:spore coat protein H
MKNKLLIFISALFLFASCEITDYNPANEITSVYLLDTYIRPENLSSLLSSKLVDFSVPLKIYINQNEFKGSIEAQGSASRYLPKWSFEIELKNGKIIDLNNFNLSAQVSDASMLRTGLASLIYTNMGFHVFNSDLAFLKINGENEGLYYIIENVEEEFFHRRNLPAYEVIKTLFNAKFTLNEGTDLYQIFEKEINDDDNLYNFENFIITLDTVSTENIFYVLGRFLDIELYLKYHAVSTVIAAKDGFRNNIIFFKRTPDSPYEVIPWDFDGSFNPSFNEIYFGDNEIINKLLQNDSCKAVYDYYFNYCLENFFTEQMLFPFIDAVINKINKPYSLDPYLGEAGYNIQQEADKLKQFISERRTLLLER